MLCQHSDKGVKSWACHQKQLQLAQVRLRGGEHIADSDDTNRQTGFVSSRLTTRNDLSIGRSACLLSESLKMPREVVGTVLS